VGAAAVADERVDLVDDHLLAAGEDRPAARGGQQQVQGFGGGDQQVRRLADHAGALARARVARAHGAADRREGQAQRGGGGLDAAQRGLQVALDVGAERLERRDVDDLHALLEAVLERPTDERVDAGEEGREGLARAGRGHDQGVLAAADRRPAAALGLGRAGEALREPALHRGAKAGRCRSVHEGATIADR
jgi:hypothetical protein